jgi:hypothetical protein
LIFVGRTAEADLQESPPDRLIVLSNVVARQLFKEGMIYEQSAAQTVREQQEKRSGGWSRQPLKIEQLPRWALPSGNPTLIAETN